VDLFSYDSVLQNGTVLYTDSVHPLTNKLSPSQQFFAYIDGSLVRNSFRVVANGTGVVSLYDPCPATTTTTTSTTTSTTTTTTTAAPTTTTTSTTTTTTEAPRFEFELGYDATSTATACSKSTEVFVYSDNAVFADSTVLFEFSTGPTKAAAGYYSDGFNVYYWNGTDTFEFDSLC
jgi:hypothetical protein